LTDGDWIEVKERLTYGEQQQLAGAALGKSSGTIGKGLTVGLDWRAYSVLRVLIWIIDWSFCDEEGKRVEVSHEAVCALDPDTVVEIENAISAHIEARDERKNSTVPGETEPGPK